MLERQMTSGGFKYGEDICKLHVTGLTGYHHKLYGYKWTMVQ